MNESSDEDQSTTTANNFLLNPEEVEALAVAIPNCNQVHPPLSETKDNEEPTPRPTSFLTLLQHKFSSEEKDEAAKKILSFLVTDSYSLEQLAAEASGKQSRGALHGAGMSRIDVYCQSGNVCVNRVIQTSDKSTHAATTSPSRVGKNLKTLPEGMQVRRVIKRRCSLEVLKMIMQCPPDFVHINPDIASTIAIEELKGAAKPVSNRRQRLMKYQSKLDNAQENFLNEQQGKYEKRVLRDDKARQRVGNAILSGYDLLTMRNVRSISSAESSLNDASVPSSESLPPSEVYDKQKAIKEKIQYADVSLAILYGEAEGLKNMIDQMKEKRQAENEADEENLGTLSTVHSSDREEDSSVSSIDTNLKETARILQGCEVEYSFNSVSEPVYVLFFQGDTDGVFLSFN